MNKNKTKLDQLTSLRFFAAFMIIIQHSKGLFGLQYSSEYLCQGVSFFFVLSGFILTYVYPNLNTWHEIKQFWKARIARITPAYFFIFLITISIISCDWDIKTAIAHLLMIQAWIPSSNFALSYNPIAWSVSTEFFFYLAFPFLIYKWNNTWFIKLIFSGIILIALMLISNLYHLPNYKGPKMGFIISESMLIYINPLARIFEFIFGMSIAILWKKTKTKQTSSFLLATIYEITAIILCAAFLYNIHYISNWAKPILGTSVSRWLTYDSGVFIFGLLIYIIAQGRGKISQILCNPFLVLLGEISFSMYLIHFSILHFYKNNISSFIELPGPISFSIFVLILAILSFLIWICVEMPGRRFILGYKSINFLKTLKDVWYNNITPSHKFIFPGLFIICSTGLLQSKIDITDSVDQIENVLPTNFDPLTYISLNPDLEKATENMTTIVKKIDWAKWHYLNHGKKEKRKY